jgi:hypothetical protein
MAHDDAVAAKCITDFTPPVAMLNVEGIAAARLAIRRANAV